MVISEDNHIGFAVADAPSGNIYTIRTSSASPGRHQYSLMYEYHGGDAEHDATITLGINRKGLKGRVQCSMKHACTLDEGDLFSGRLVF